MHNNIGGFDFDGHAQIDAGERHNGNVMERTITPKVRFKSKSTAIRMAKRVSRSKISKLRNDKKFEKRSGQLDFILSPAPEAIPFEVPEEIVDQIRVMLQKQFTERRQVLVGNVTARWNYIEKSYELPIKVDFSVQ